MTVFVDFLSVVDIKLPSGVGAVFVLWFSRPTPSSFHSALPSPARGGRYPKTQGQRDVWRWALLLTQGVYFTGTPLKVVGFFFGK